MPWLGANQELLSSKIKSDNATNSETIAHNTNNKNLISGRNTRRKELVVCNETVEAALNRISKAYSTAMDCVGAWHKADIAITSNKVSTSTSSTSNKNLTIESFTEAECQSANSIDNPYFDIIERNRKTLIRVGTVARATFENAILLDPLISNQHSSTLEYTLLQLEETYKQNHPLVKTLSETNRMDEKNCDIIVVEQIEETILERPKRLSPVTLTSIGHKLTIQQIAYLSLVNYGDLLLAGIPPTSQSGASTNRTILDRGLVKSLRAFECKGSAPILTESCWNRSFQTTTTTTTTTTTKNTTMHPPESGYGNVSVEHEESKGAEVDMTNNNKPEHSTTLTDDDIKSSEVEKLQICENVNINSDRVMSDNKVEEEDLIMTSTSSNEQIKKQSEKMDYFKVESPLNELEKKITTTSTTSKPTTNSFKEPVKDTVRLAVVAYIDATSIDGSDPTVWMKLACASRRLGRLLSIEDKDNNEVGEIPATALTYRRLEKYAMEMAMSCLGPREAPNRTAVRAMLEWKQEESELKQYAPALFEHYHPAEDQQKLTIHLTRYCWLNLGRMLIRVCKEGSDYSRPVFYGSTSKKKHEADISKEFFSSPNISIQLPSILGLPQMALACICSYMEPSELRDFEATCRTMSVSINAVRSILIELTQTNQCSKTMSASPPKVSAVDGGELNADAEERRSRGNVHGVERRRGSRVSHRVRSQAIASEKRLERKKRRQCVDYCLLAATLGCTSEDSRYLHLLVDATETKQGHSNSSCNHMGSRGNSYPSSLPHQPSHNKLLHEMRENLQDFTSDSSLFSFLEKWSSRSVSTPTGLLFSFVAHVSIHVSDVFSCDPSVSSALTSCLLECFELMASRRQLHKFLIPSWQASGSIVPQGAHLKRMDLFALDLLHAELRLKRCDLEDFIDSDFDGDGSFLSMIIPFLLKSMEEIETDVSMNTKDFKLLCRLKARCYWLVSNFYLWRGRLSSSVADSRYAEKEGLRFIELSKKQLMLPESCPVQTIPTPHLESRKRRGLYWRELSPPSLSVFSNELQASSIVLQAQEQFLEAITKIGKTDDDLPLQKEDSDSLFAIGESLLRRYDTLTDVPAAKHTELIEDFLSIQGASLLAESEEDRLRSWFDEVILVGNIDKASLLAPSCQCILAILMKCLQTRKDKYKDIIVLLVRLVTTLTGLHENLQISVQDSGEDLFSSVPVENYHNVDDDSISSDGENLSAHRNISKRTKRVKQRQYASLIRLLLMKIDSVYSQLLNSTEKTAFAQLDDFTYMVDRVLSLTSDWFSVVGSTATDGSINDEDLDIFHSTNILMKSILSSPETKGATQHISKVYFLGLIQVLVSQRSIFSKFSNTKPSHKERSSRLRTTRRRADLVAAVSCEVGLLLSKHPVAVSHSGIDRSPLTNDLSTSQLALLLDTVLLFWRIATDNSDSISEKAGGEMGFLGGYLDRPGKDRLKIPLATAIVGLCGSAVTTSRCLPNVAAVGCTDNTTELISLGEFYDSGADSASELLSDNEVGGEKFQKQQEVMRVIMQSVYCINNVFSHISDSDLVGFTFVREYTSKNGPILPLIVCRVLNRFSVCLLTKLTENNEQDLWSPEYPYGTQSIGQLLDSVLHKAYKCLHGFTIATISGSDTKDNPVNSTVSGSVRKLEYPPENASAAAMLYRCIIRAYSNSRKSPPKVALDFILDALPDTEETDKSRAIHQYLYTECDYFHTKDLSLIIRPGPNLEISFSHIKAFTMPHDDNNDYPCVENESMTVRRGVLSLLAQGPLPLCQDNGDLTDRRQQSVQTEEEFSRKFTAIIDDLRFSKLESVEGWYKASQCLLLKADLIADRLGLSRGFDRNHDFCVTDRARLLCEKVSITDLEIRQERELKLKSEGWVESLGNDLSLFVRYNWSDLSSLASLSAEVGKIHIDLLTKRKDNGADDHEQENRFKALIWKEIDELFIKNDIVAWQQAWGSLFVSALRKIACRCYGMSLFVAHKQNDKSKDHLLVSEIIESLGIMLYSNLSGSQTYGYPMHVTPEFRKRELAAASLACFERAVEMINEREENTSQWDLTFMMGKCYEKIAKTYLTEEFIQLEKNLETEEHRVTRKYEHYMSHALQCYETSLTEAKELEKDGVLGLDHDGGSNHGVTEVIYRLHATRLKCLIAAVNYKTDREIAEQEALRLTECHWFSTQDELTSNLTVRDRTWRVLADVVAALALCRLEKPYFHRSVYRHAQALMWAPVLYDPVGGRSSGSLGTVPSTWAFKLRGLNYATNAASSAVVVVSSLFEKKRNQLCAVWVTENTSMSAFGSINSSVRKYDTLRAKYISAYVDSLRLCNLSKELETFLRWVYSSNRDLPAFFAATANALGGKPKHPHSHDSLVVEGRSLSSKYFLTSVKRLTNSALAALALREVTKSDYNTDAKFLEDKLKLAYACFLRLNCDASTLMKRRAWKYDRGYGAKDVVGALTAAYLKLCKDQRSVEERNEWGAESLLTVHLQSALQKSKELFPTLSGSYFSNKKIGTPRKKGESSDAPAIDPAEEKNSETAQEKISYEVGVPEGLSEGDTFTTSVKVGSKVKKVRLTVPRGDKKKTLRFALQIPDVSDGSNKSAKRRRMRD